LNANILLVDVTNNAVPMSLAYYIGMRAENQLLDSAFDVNHEMAKGTKEHPIPYALFDMIFGPKLRGDTLKQAKETLFYKWRPMLYLDLPDGVMLLPISSEDAEWRLSRDQFLETYQPMNVLVEVAEGH